jgi:hypothetical protein
MKKKKKVKSKPKKKVCKKSCSKSISCEKAYGDPTPVKPLRPVCEYYNLETGEIYPKIFFKESWWVKIKRFLGLIP